MIPLIKTARRLALNITDGGERMAWRRRGGGGGEKLFYGKKNGRSVK